VRAVVIGATGATGKELVKALVEDDRFSKVVIIARHKGEIISDKIEEHIIDFDYITKFAELIDGDILFSVMGTTLKKAGSKDRQYMVDYTYQHEVAKIASANRISHYLLLSSIGANTEASSFYLRVKGKLEEAVKQLEFDRVSIFRPSILEAKRDEFRWGEEIGLLFMKLFGFLPYLSRFRPIKVARLARAMIRASVDLPEQTVTTYELEAIFRLSR
jgi:uncharacterized protein YbjT (DUF2867 family)